MYAIAWRDKQYQIKKHKPYFSSNTVIKGINQFSCVLFFLFPYSFDEFQCCNPDKILLTLQFQINQLLYLTSKVNYIGVKRDMAGKEAMPCGVFTLASLGTLTSHHYKRPTILHQYDQSPRKPNMVSPINNHEMVPKA